MDSGAPESSENEVKEKEIADSGVNNLIPEDLNNKDPNQDSEKLNEGKEKKLSSPKKSKSLKKGSKKADYFDFDIPKMHGIPILNKDTVNPNTFDLNYLLNPEVQKIAQSGHRLTQSSTVSTGKKAISPTNHIKKNILNSKNCKNSKSNKEIPIEIPEVSVTKKVTCDVDERFYKKAKQTEEKIKNLKALKEIHEIDGCTFKPQIKAKRPAKTYEEYYEYMKKFSEQKEKKIKYIQEVEKQAKEKTSEFTHQPKLCEKSLQMIARKSDIEESTYDRLHKLYKSQSKLNTSGKESILSESKSEENLLSFQPTVNKRSQMLNRSEPVEKILYDDALRRINKDKEPPVPIISKFITSKSEKVLIEKLKRDFEEAYCSIEAEVINYTKMIELFKLLHLVKDESKKEEERLLLLEAWRNLCIDGENYCKKENLISFIIAIMGFYEEWMGYSSAFGPGMNQIEANKIHLRFDLFYTNRISVINKSTINKSYKNNYEYSFHPQTIAESEALAESWRVQHRSGGKIEDMLISERQNTLKKLQQKKANQEEALLEECSFQPIIEQMPEEFRIYGTYEREDITAEYFKLMNDPKFQNTHKGLVLHDLAKISKQKKETKKNEKEKEKIEKELKNCTFAPKLEERILPEGYVPPDYRSSIFSSSPKEKSIRISEANSPKEKSIKFTEVYSPMNSSIKKNASFDGKNTAKKIGAKKNTAEEKVKAYNDLKKLVEEESVKKEQEGIILESNDGNFAKYNVNIGGKSDKLVFDIQKDDPTFKVMEFSKSFGLKKADEYKLVKELTLVKQNYT